MWDMLVAAGADPEVVDNEGHGAAFYMEHPEEAPSSLPEAPSSAAQIRRRFTSGKDGRSHVHIVTSK